MDLQKTFIPYKSIVSTINKPDKVTLTNNFTIIKQFGFNGANYNTNMFFGDPQITAENKLKIVMYRRYSKSSRWAYWYTIDDNIIYPPFSSDCLVSQKFENKKFDETPKIAFNQPDADFKKNLSFYYPVWDKRENMQKCVMCDPTLITHVKLELASGEIKSAVIQFSNRKFDQYIYYPIANTLEPNFVFSFFNGISSLPNEISTTRKIYLDEVNPNIRVGDYVLDSENTLDSYLKDFKRTLTSSGSNNDIYMLQQFNEKRDSYYRKFR